MINNIKLAIVDKLLEWYPGYTSYDEELPQDFNKPSFLITLKEQKYNKRMNEKYVSSLSFDISYLSNKTIAELKNDCLDVQLILFKVFDLVGNYRILNKKATITENVLHFTFDIKYSVINHREYMKMQQQQINTRTEE